ncbi:MAG: NAD(P)/FAD-dependent oxidoreductase [Cytophagales bacterium]|nr:NAD(P)/FAD-dependent oxidoreductase [Cytophagales bacterium]
MNNIVKYDVAIVGGGIAGLCTALQLANAGYKVCLIEKETYPIHKVCGEYISMESYPFLEQVIGFPFHEFSLPRITQLHISSPRGNIIQHMLKPGGFGISRHTFDHELWQMAHRKGVVLHHYKVENILYADNQYIINTTQKVEISARLAIGCWGKRSNIDIKNERKFTRTKYKGQHNYIGVKYHIHADLPDHIIELHNFKDGYAGISKVENDTYCLCYLTTSNNLSEYQNSIPMMEERMLMCNPWLKNYLTKYKKITPTPVSISQITFDQKELIHRHIPMAGDSAGMIAPLCGNGMSMAMHASKILSGLAIQYLEHKISLDELCNQYTQVWNGNFAARLRAGRILQSLLGSEFLTEAVIALLKPFPPVVSALVGLTHGKTF